MGEIATLDHFISDLDQSAAKDQSWIFRSIFSDLAHLCPSLLLWREEDAALRRLSLLASRLLIKDSLTWRGGRQEDEKV